MKTIIDFIKENKDVIDNKYFKLFWKTISNKNKWIYLSDEIILEYLTNETGKYSIVHFIKRMLIGCNDYEENIHYKKINKDDPLVVLNRKTSHNKKYYAVTDKTFKILLIRSRTSNGISLCNYYIDLEQIFVSYLHYQCKYHNLDINVEVDMLSNVSSIAEYSDAIRKQEFTKKLQDIYKIGYVYYIQEEDSKNIKIGYTFNLDERLSQLQTANSQKLTIVKYEKCIFPHIREQELHKQYINYHIHGEWFKNMLI
jgi:hypothetical protein